MAEDYFGSINSELGIENSLLLGSRNCWLALFCILRELYSLMGGLPFDGGGTHPSPIFDIPDYWKSISMILYK